MSDKPVTRYKVQGILTPNHGPESPVGDYVRYADYAAAESRVTDLTRELAMWRSEHDPCPLSVENERLGARVAELETALKESEREVRHLLWTTHGHSGIYGDDGEMQCAKCAWHGCWDYKNAPLEEVRKAYRAAMLERAALPAPPSEGKP